MSRRGDRRACPCVLGLADWLACCCRCRKPTPFNPLQDVAFHALSHAYAIGYVLCAIAALAAAALALAAVRGRVHETLLDPQALEGPQVPADS